MYPRGGAFGKREITANYSNLFRTAVPAQSHSQFSLYTREYVDFPKLALSPRYVLTQMLVISGLEKECGVCFVSY